jgi:hypothetical protein
MWIILFYYSIYLCRCQWDSYDSCPYGSGGRSYNCCYCCCVLLRTDTSKYQIRPMAYRGNTISFSTIFENHRYVTVRGPFIFISYSNASVLYWLTYYCNLEVTNIQWKIRHFTYALQISHRQLLFINRYASLDLNSIMQNIGT